MYKNTLRNNENNIKHNNILLPFFDFIAYIHNIGNYYDI